jgi:cellulose synthase/poly-beta-1,6-N-acetylglucosamine synthase-like glycosyltransferase
MLERTLRALVDMRVPHDTWVLDEEGDARLRALCTRLGARYFCRGDVPADARPEDAYARSTKHGNYNVWLDDVGFDHYDVLAAFDPDHVPRPDYLERLLGYLRDPGVAYVQSAPGYYNRSASFVARAGAEEVYQHAASVLTASYGAGYAPLIGSHNLHRLTALRELGGFPAHHAEDVLTATLYRVAGWRGVYVPERLALGLAPVSWRTYLRQQRRWARGHVDLKLRFLPKALAGVRRRERLGAYLHGLHFLTSALVPVALGLVAAWLATGSAPLRLWHGGAFVAAPLAAIALCELFRQRFALAPDERGLLWRAAVVRIAKWPYILLGIVDGLLGRALPYELTDKNRRSAPERLLPAVTAGTVAGIGAAWAYGAAEGGLDDPGLHALAAVVVAPLLVVLATCIPRPRPEFESTLTQGSA